MDINQHTNEARNQMQKAVQHLEEELTKVRAGKVSPAMVDGILVEYYGSEMPITQVANVSASDARTLVIQPWEKNMLGKIEHALQAANLGANPHSDGVAVKLFMPPLTEERRKDFVKKAHNLAELARVGIRNIRREANDHIKKLKSDHVSEDDIKNAEGKIQELTNQFIALIDKHVAAKEKEIMTV